MKNTLLLSLLVFSIFIPCSAQEKITPVIANQQTKIENNQNAQSLPVVEFVGNKVVSSEILKKRADECLVKYAQYIKNNFSGTMAQCLRESQKLIWQKGYLQAKFSEPQIQQTAAGIKAIVTVDEGIAYRLGEVTFESLKVLSVEGVNKLTNSKKANWLMVCSFRIGLSQSKMRIKNADMLSLW